MSNPQPFTTTNTCKRCFNFNSIWHLEVMRQEIGGSRLLPPSCPFSSLYLCLVLGSSWQAQCLVPASGCLGWAPSALSGDGRSGGGGWLGGWVGPCNWGCASAPWLCWQVSSVGLFAVHRLLQAPSSLYVVMVGLGWAIYFLLDLGWWAVGSGRDLPVHFVILHAGALWLDLDLHCCGCLGSLSSWVILSPP